VFESRPRSWVMANPYVKTLTYCVRSATARGGWRETGAGVQLQLVGYSGIAAVTSPTRIA
jgi:hypothetical protein